MAFWSISDSAARAEVMRWGTRAWSRAPVSPGRGVEWGVPRAWRRRSENHSAAMDMRRADAVAFGAVGGGEVVVEA